MVNSLLGGQNDLALPVVRPLIEPDIAFMQNGFKIFVLRNKLQLKSAGIYCVYKFFNLPVLAKDLLSKSLSENADFNFTKRFVTIL